MTDPHRPRYHFTVPTGWLNDPYGVTWHDGGYQLFFQYRPTAPQWSPRICWGQSRGPDLVRWAPPTVALAPSGEETGCWSGTVVLDGDRPTVLYTGVGPGDRDLGRIVTVAGDAAFRSWAGRRDVVLAPPPGIGVTHFRDPFVWRAADGWHMLVGGGIDGGIGGGIEPATAAVFGYTSPDLVSWTFRGVVCARPDPSPEAPSESPSESPQTGAFWECPQLVELDGAWVLIVSVAPEGGIPQVMYAVGDFDGTRFAPQRWDRLLYGDAPYATTTFLDAAGRRCALSWLREEGPVRGRAWAGALSVPMLLRRDGRRVTASPHPDVDALRTTVRADLREVRVGAPPLPVGPVGAQADVVLAGRLAPRDRLELAVQAAAGAALTVVVEGDRDRVTLRRSDRPDLPCPLGAAADGAFELRLLLDGPVAEIFTPGGAAGGWIRPAADTGELTLSAPRGRPWLHQLTVHDLTVHDLAVHDLTVEELAAVAPVGSALGEPPEAEAGQV